MASSDTLRMPTSTAQLTPLVIFSPMACLKELVRLWFLPKQDLLNLAPAIRQDLLRCRNQEELISNLVDWRLLTSFQANRLITGATFGLVLGNYRVLDRLGTGSMGVVYRGEHCTLRDPVAIKVLPCNGDQDPRVLQRFFNEVRTVAKLHHPSIVTAIDTGGVSSPDDRGTVLHYFVMEYLRGQDLQRLIHGSGPLPIEQACRWIGQIAAALVEAQRNQLVHRDLKPSNILITHEGRAKLLDFGLAVHRRNDTVFRGHIIGTLDYMAPEQFENAREVDSRADIYALGGVLHWCLTGKKPFPAEQGQIYDFSKRFTTQAPSPRAHRPEVPREVDLLVRRMMMPYAVDRIDCPGEVLRVLKKFTQ